jgi:hypothetical protein
MLKIAPISELVRTIQLVHTREIVFAPKAIRDGAQYCFLGSSGMPASYLGVKKEKS